MANLINKWLILAGKDKDLLLVLWNNRQKQHIYREDKRNQTLLQLPQKRFWEV